MKVNEFEKGLVSTRSVKRFSKESNMHYTYRGINALLDNLDDLSEMIQHHQLHQRPRLETLQSYYEAENTNILRPNRRREDHLADNRAVHAFGEYVSGFIQGYMVGIPLKTNYPIDSVDEQLREINRVNDADEHNSELVLDQSIYGRAYELLYRSQADETRFTVSEVQHTFVIYDDTVEQNPIAGVRYLYNAFSEKTTVYLYTSSVINSYDLREDYSLTLLSEQSHAFDGVPIIEYSNNRFRRGDFEKVLSLIDLYDEAESDTANYMTDFNDAMLKITGNVDIDANDAKQMKEHNLILLQTEPDAEGKQTSADADYIYKKYDVQGTESYKDRVKNDIHMFTYTPNMDDDSFSGNQSGEALKYKLFGLEQKRATKERLFKKSLRERYRLINNIMTLASEGSFEPNSISITFTPNLPKSIKDEIDSFTSLGGELSDETKLSLLSFVENPQEEIAKREEERKQQRQTSSYMEVES
ncbi:phage portal protein [Oceanobacillus timonensis]|uniref:phage portal protein n=1 Tax=Oceanobacillus timonensis TaxID=1926285 RepID=UPI0009BC6073|nr:phage portal protein [Oceanobacillus timonensis]